MSEPLLLLWELEIGVSQRVATWHVMPASIVGALQELVPLKTGCELRLVHENVHPDYAAHTEARWTGILYGLGVTLEANIDNQRKDPFASALGGHGGCAKACRIHAQPNDYRAQRPNRINRKETQLCDS